MKRLFCAAALCLIPAAAHIPVAAQASDVHDVYGLWLSEAKDGQIEITDCGDGTPCGALVWVDMPNPEAQTDNLNKDENLRGRPLLGIPMLWDFERKKKGWKKGKIYNPEDGKTYRSVIKRESENTLNIKGCLGPICQGNLWTRVE